MLASTSWASTIVGNGGDAVVCRNDAKEIQSVEMLDLYEGRVDENYRYKMGEGVYQKRAKRVLKRLQKVSPEWNEYLNFLLKNFEGEARFLDGITLTDIPDSDHTHWPSGCKVEQIAIHKEPTKSEKHRYTVNNDLFQKMDENGKAALLLHEVVYRMLLEYNQSDSRAARKLVAWLASDKFEQVSESEFSHFLTAYKVYKSVPYPGLHLDENSIETHPNGAVKVARVQWGRNSHLIIGGRPYVFGATRRGAQAVAFHPNGQIATVSISNELNKDPNITLMGMKGEMNLTRHNPIILFYPNGNVRQTTRVQLEIRQGGIEFKSSPAYGSHLSYVLFYENGLVKRVRLNGDFEGEYEKLPIVVKGEEYIVYYEIHFHETGAVKATELARGRMVTVGNKTIYANRGRIKFDLSGNVVCANGESIRCLDE